MVQPPEPPRRPEKPPPQYELQEPQLLLELPAPEQVEELEEAAHESDTARRRRLLHLEEPRQKEVAEYLQ